MQPHHRHAAPRVQEGAFATVAAAAAGDGPVIYPLRTRIDRLFDSANPADPGKDARARTPGASSSCLVDQETVRYA